MQKDKKRLLKISLRRMLNIKYYVKYYMLLEIKTDSTRQLCNKNDTEVFTVLTKKELS